MQDNRELYTYVKKMGGTAHLIGLTQLNNPLIMIKKGDDRLGGGILVTAAIHAREYITSYLVCRLAQEYQGDYPIHFVPLLNPDGVFLCRGGVDTIADKIIRYELIDVNGSRNFALWKANSRAVDLNVNFDANWGAGLSNVCYKRSSDYIGPYPFSERETKAVKRLLKRYHYGLCLCYHSKGEEVYWGFEEDIRYLKEAQIFADRLGYALKESRGSAGGLKDYFTLVYKRLGLTIEVGSDSYSHPYPMGQLDNLCIQHQGSLELAVEIVKKLEEDKRY